MRQITQQWWFYGESKTMSSLFLQKQNKFLPESLDTMAARRPRLIAKNDEARVLHTSLAITFVVC
jgi:hypothetical protein